MKLNYYNDQLYIKQNIENLDIEIPKLPNPTTPQREPKDRRSTAKTGIVAIIAVAIKDIISYANVDLQLEDDSIKTTVRNQVSSEYYILQKYVG